jgi:ABC-type transport system substrate-binding protein
MKELRLAWPDQPRRLDPAFSKDLFEGIASGLLFDGLVGYGDTTEIEPRLAESYSVAEDFTSLTFRLRPEARFHDGRPVESADVRYSFERVLHRDTASDRRWVLNRIAGSDAFTSGLTPQLLGLMTPDNKTVVILLDRPSPVFLQALAMPAASIVPRGSGSVTGGGASAGTALDTQPIGTGPWKLVDWQRDRRLTFERHGEFWGKLPAFDRLIYQVITDDSVRRTAFAQGRIDLFEVGFQDWQRYQSDLQLQARLLPNQELRTDFLGLGCSRPALGDVRVRRALYMGLDREIIFRTIQKSRGIIAHGPVPPLPGWSPPDPIPHDPDEAQRLLAQVGYTVDHPLRLALWYRELALNGEIVAEVRQQWSRLGIQVDLIPRDQAAFRAAIWDGQPDVFLGSWTLDYPDPENALVPPFHSRNIPRQGNQAQLRNPHLDQVLEQAKKSTDPAKRLQLFQQAEALVMELHPWIPLFHRRTYHDTSPRIQGWKPKLMYHADRFLDVTPAEI